MQEARVLLISGNAKDIDPAKVAVLSMNLCESKVWKAGSDDADLYRELIGVLKSGDFAQAKDSKTLIRLRSKLCELTGWVSVHDLNELSTAYARAGDFATAVKWANKALDLAPATEKPFYREVIDVYQRQTAGKKKP